MKLLIMFLALCTMLALSRAGPVNSTAKSQPIMGLCYHQRRHCSHLIGSFCPECDSYGNFLPQQCSGSTGYCWCVDVITGEEIPHTKTAPGQPPINCEGDLECPLGWSRFGERCFMFISSPKPWAEAEFYCQFEGANLASIHSYDENHFVQALTRGDTHNFPQSWIGGTNAINVELWMWCDGSKFNYENWYDDDHDDEDERCLKMNYPSDLKWSTANCTQTLPFVCSKSI